MAKVGQMRENKSESENVMKNVMKSQNLTAEQYRRTNRIMYVILTLCYIFFIGIEYSNGMKGVAASGSVGRMAVYAVLILILGVVIKFIGTKKTAMVIMALSYLVSYPLLCFGNGAGSLALAFPILVGFMIF